MIWNIQPLELWENKFLLMAFCYSSSSDFKQHINYLRVSGGRSFGAASLDLLRVSQSCNQGGQLGCSLMWRLHWEEAAFRLTWVLAEFIPLRWWDEGLAPCWLLAGGYSWPVEAALMPCRLGLPNGHLLLQRQLGREISSASVLQYGVWCNVT